MAGCVLFDYGLHPISQIWFTMYLWRCIAQ